MSWYAIDAVEDAVDVTRGFLLPFDLRRWLTLAVMVFFLGGGSGAGGGASNGATNSGTMGPGGPVSIGGFDLTGAQFVNLLIALVAVIVVLALLFGLIGSIMRFVFVDALRTREARIRGRFGARAGQGLWLFAFEFVIFLLILAPIAVAVLPAVLGFASFLVVLLAIPFVFLFGLFGGLAILFTNEFVVPVMIAADVGVIAGWRRFWPTLRAEWKQFGVYLVVRIVLGIAVSFVVGIVAGVIVIPLALLGALLFLGPLSSTALVVIAVVAVPVFLLFLVILLLVQVPIQTYLTYFSLLVLGDANPAFDLLPDHRPGSEDGETEDGETDAGGV